ncbi:unnamed protein product [Phytophthora lilii]|uniref:Unnamed protein product n=1 Tax=Phytophthora lilii TaxID=2077276 RepID=A0A9W6U834_9STRA|nr:unnamed protein product [Phytophthora lilii]
MQLVAARKHPPPSSEADSINGKRKRDVDVIVIDDDDDINGDNVEISPPGTNEAFDSRACNSAATLNQKKKQNGGVSVAAVNALSRVGGTATQPQGNPYTNAGAAFVPSPAAHNSMIEPIPFTATSSVQPNVTFTSSSMPNGPYQANINTSSGTQWNNGVDNFHGSATSMATPNISAGVDASVMRSGMLQMSPTSMANAMSTPMNTTSGVWSTTSAMNTTSGVWSTTSAISTDMASASYPSNLLPLGGAVFAENALVDSLVDRYHEMNQTVTNMELQCNQLTQQIAVATCQGPYVAAPVMGALNNLQPMLQNAKARRDKFLIAMIIQSHDIMAAVRLLRLTELGDVPQVPMISHRKCLQISNEINLHKKKLIELNQRLSKTLNQSHAVGLRWENNLIRRTSASIQMHERSIKKLKKDREVEIVRIVQFSKNIRDALKRAFQRSVEIQRQQQQQQQQQQQFPPYG